MSRTRVVASTPFGIWLLGKLDQADMSFIGFAEKLAARRNIRPQTAVRYVQNWSTKAGSLPPHEFKNDICEILGVLSEEINPLFTSVKSIQALDWSVLTTPLDELASNTSYDRSFPGEYVCYGLVLGDPERISVSKCQISHKIDGKPLEFRFWFKQQTSAGLQEFQASGVVVFWMQHAFFIGCFEADRKDLFMVTLMLDAPGRELNEMDGIVAVIQASRPSPPGAERVSFYRVGTGYDHEIGPFLEEEFPTDTRQKLDEIRERLFENGNPAQIRAWIPTQLHRQRTSF